MKVHIEGRLYLESDGMSFIIVEYSGKKDKNGNDLYKTHGYFSSVKSALRYLASMKVMKSTATTLQELVQDIKRIEQYIESKIGV